MIIDHTYFVGKINLPQVGNTPGRDTVDEFIEIYETEYLKKILGYDLWKAFTDGIDGSGPHDQRWEDLLAGKDYDFQGHNKNWPGFEAKPSPIGQYVYYQYMENGAAINTLVGTATQAVDNNNKVSPFEKMVSAWNDMVELNILLWNFLYANRTVYPEWKYQHWWGTWFWPVYSHQFACNKNELYNLKNYHDL